MKSFIEWVRLVKEGTDSFFSVGQIWNTSYGVAKVKEMLSPGHGGGARFEIINASPSAIKLGLKKGMIFLADPRDPASLFGKGPSPSTWKLMDAGSGGDESQSMKSEFLLARGNQKIHPSMLALGRDGGVDLFGPIGDHQMGIAVPTGDDSLIMDGEEMKKSSQSAGGFTRRGAEFTGGLVFVGRNAKLEMPVSEWIKLARKGKIIKREDGKFEMLG